LGARAGADERGSPGGAAHPPSRTPSGCVKFEGILSGGGRSRCSLDPRLPSCTPPACMVWRRPAGAAEAFVCLRVYSCGPHPSLGATLCLPMGEGNRRGGDRRSGGSGRESAPSAPMGSQSRLASAATVQGVAWRVGNFAASALLCGQ
jgi:hypothetical protein